MSKKHNQSKNQARIEEDAPIQNFRMRLNIYTMAINHTDVQLLVRRTVSNKEGRE